MRRIPLPKLLPLHRPLCQFRSSMSTSVVAAEADAPAPPGPLEGVFAIHKPAGITSAQVLRDIQTHLSPSAMFQPWIAAEQAKNQEQQQQQHRSSRRSRRFNNRPQVKVGHGGTLDPLATGVLIVGLGSGTRTLGSFLAGTKEYDTTVLFGAATDSYDSAGVLTRAAPAGHVRPAAIEDALRHRFSGAIAQKPPIFSALKVKGKPMYEYARSGAAVPEVEARPVTVLAVRLEEFFEPGEHAYPLPPLTRPVDESLARERPAGKRGRGKESRPAEQAEKNKEDKENTENTETSPVAEEDHPSKRLAGPERTALAAPASHHLNQAETAVAASAPAPATVSTEQAAAETSPAEPAEPVPAAPATPAQTPAARISMTVSSGFYVRSLCNDLADLLGSAGHMVRLARTRQSNFSLKQPFPADLGADPAEAFTDADADAAGSSSGTTIPVLPYEDLQAGEAVWAPKLAYLLKSWALFEAKKGPD